MTTDAHPTPIETARRTARTIGDLPANFMLDGETYRAAAEVGYEGMAFYYAGRAGVLGDVDARVVTEAFVFFPPTSVEVAWTSSAEIEPRDASARRFAGALATWTDAHMPTDALDYQRLADLLGIVIRKADPTGAPVFAGWRVLDEPDDPRALALHRLNALRELRAARHGAAVLEVGLAPLEALMVKTPFMADVFGWPEPRPEPDETLRERWQSAEDETDRRFAEDLAALDGAERAELEALLDDARRALRASSTDT